MSQFQIRKDDFLTQRLVPLNADTTESTLAPGQIRLAVDSFSFTANNITYAAAGDTGCYAADTDYRTSADGGQCTPG